METMSELQEKAEQARSKAYRKASADYELAVSRTQKKRDEAEEAAETAYRLAEQEAFDKINS